jgi:hypothetical protein
VMENPGGRSTIPFSYRIVAKPFGAAASRLPMTEMRQRPTQVPERIPRSAARRNDVP